VGTPGVAWGLAEPSPPGEPGEWLLLPPSLQICGAGTEPWRGDPAGSSRGACQRSGRNHPLAIWTRRERRQEAPEAAFSFENLVRKRTGFSSARMCQPDDPCCELRYIARIRAARIVMRPET